MGSLILLVRGCQVIRLCKTKTLIAAVAPTTITKSAVHKTIVREVAEKSIRSSISYLMTIAVTMFQLGPLQTGRTHVSKATKGAQAFEKLVSEANGGLPVHPLYPRNIHSTDDSGVYFVAAMNNKDEFEWRVAKDDGENNGFRSKYKSNNNSSLMGQRCKLTWSASADGTVAPAYVTFSGLSERELPPETCPDGIYVIEVPGLAIGGTNPDCKSVGYIVFMRKGRDVETTNFRHYRQSVFRPYVESKRGLPEGVPIPDDEQAASWSDGATPQLKAILDCTSMMEDSLIKLTDNKHSASRSAVEQYLDLMPIFKLVHKFAKTMTARGRTKSGFKKQVMDTMHERQRSGEICLSTDKMTCIVDFAICLPEILTRSVTTTRILDGFVQGGAIDSVSYEWPDMHKVLGTCRRDIKKEEVDLVEKHFSELYKAHLQHGKIPEELFDHLGFQKDLDSKGNVHLRESADISHSRAMCLSAEPIREARRKKLEIVKKRKKEMR